MPFHPTITHAQCNTFIHLHIQTFDFEALMKRTLKAPWVPKVTSLTDTSNFDPYGVDDHVDDGYIDHGNWDKDF